MHYNSAYIIYLMCFVSKSVTLANKILA